MRIGVVENVWDYPRPPALDACARHVRVELGGAIIADSRAALRILETSHAPTIYIPPGDFADGAISESSMPGTMCEWKGMATYLDLAGGDRWEPRAAWTYRDPIPAYAQLRDHICVYPGRVDRCLLDGELVRSQQGDFYGGWITSDLAGPFKGGPGTLGW